MRPWRQRGHHRQPGGNRSADPVRPSHPRSAPAGRENARHPGQDGVSRHARKGPRTRPGLHRRPRRRQGKTRSPRTRHLTSAQSTGSHGRPRPSRSLPRAGLCPPVPWRGCLRGSSISRARPLTCNSEPGSEVSAASCFRQPWPRRGRSRDLQAQPSAQLAFPWSPARPPSTGPGHAGSPASGGSIRLAVSSAHVRC
jgi:hypothetical protein